ncbi:MAG TPA: SpoIIE family protein phosphatase [Candidatus Limnocylindrales bacterium]|jgi:sigma-B regulation protein RsbU (phosphoserine phosphatase)|nr:SpoIIE family protein phosphatase [Candidatus Limnocylindrales bacterium]
MPQDKMRVLLIEHDAGFCRYVSEMLGQARDLHAEILPVENLRRGLSTLAGDQVDVVLMDMSLPDGAGLANVSLLRAEAPQLPIIVAGDSDDESVALEAVHAGAHDYLVKGQLTPGWLERSLRYAIERRRMDRALVDAEEKYHSVFDHLVEGIFQTTPDGHYLMANAALARIYGYNSPEELMQSLTDISRRLYVEEHRREEFIKMMQEQDVITAFESQVFRKDGTRIWISENCRAIRDSKGRLLYYEGTVEDITQRREAEEKVRRSEVLYHSLVETLPQNIFRKDLQCRFTFANQQFCKTLGRPLEEIVGKTDFDFFPQELAEKYQRDDRRVIETGQPYETVEEHQPPGGSKLFVQVVKTPLRDADGHIIGLQAIFWDITQQRMAEQEIRRANAALAQSRAEIQAKNLQMEDDLKMAREIQLAILPQQYPSFPGFGPQSESTLQFTHRYLPTGSVGGDFFSISSLSETQAGVFLCDVAGHGVRSALITAMIRALVEELKPLALQPGEFLTKLNSELFTLLKHSGIPLLTTAFYLVADGQSGRMLYANAGHPRPFHLSRAAGTALPLSNATGKGQPALGLMEKTSYRTSETQLAPGDLVLLFTDGIVEVQNQTDELYTQQLLLAAVQARLQLPAAQLFDEILAEVHRFSAAAEFTDDVCLVGVELTKP